MDETYDVGIGAAPQGCAAPAADELDRLHAYGYLTAPERADYLALHFTWDGSRRRLVPA